MSTTRAFFTSFRIATLESPYDTATLKVYYPASFSNSELERNTGQVPCNNELAPFPVTIFLPGVNVEPSYYTWLASELAAHGIVTVIPSLIAEEMPGSISLTPGIDMAALTPEIYGSRPSAVLLPAIQEKLGELNEKGLLAGKLDLERLALGGHSAGGTLALINGRSEWLPGLRALFSYGAHTGAATALGWEADTLLAPQADIPLLLAGGDSDGCIAASGKRYGDTTNSSGHCSGRIEETFSRAVASNDNKNWLCILQQANHFSVCHPADECTGRGFLDFPVANPDEARELLGNLFATFLSTHLRDQEAEVFSAMIKSQSARFAIVQNK
ncbi:hypothetical protein PVT68_00640 [Microbulbifer bruguierae]|uniref:Alpha/beta hydrolase n=1 Tax=Microbulbifer bruguierae TaxID=3029061 RepID=A0ABY8NFH4_9GAMM|nr:hypothetical protein [Microbulbifer bruguierae]WGL16822.1 hypothetical protein PVT68_00640 [Microbulbifer bruguierae]